MFKPTGIVRYLDDLGRVVLPREYRKELHLDEKDPVEIKVTSSGEIIIKKYYEMGQLQMLAVRCVDTLCNLIDAPVCMTNQDEIIAISDGSNFWDKTLNDEYKQKMNSAIVYQAEPDSTQQIMLLNKAVSCIQPILLENGDVIGSIAVLGQPKDLNLNYLRIATDTIQICLQC